MMIIFAVLLWSTLSDSALAGHPISYTLEEVVILSDIVGIVEITSSAASDSHKTRVGRIRDVRVIFVWKRVIRRSPDVTIGEKKNQFMSYRHRGYSEPHGCGRYLAMLVQEDKQNYVPVGRAKVSLLPITRDNEVELFLGAGIRKFRESAQSDRRIPLSEVERLIEASVIPDQVQAFECSSIRMRGGGTRKANGTTFLRLEFSTYNAPGGVLADYNETRFGYRLCGHFAEPDLDKNELKRLTSKTAAPQLIEVSGEWESGFFTIHRVKSRATSKTLQENASSK